MSAKAEALKALLQVETDVRRLVRALEAGKDHEAAQALASFDAWLLTVRKMIEVL